MKRELEHERREAIIMENTAKREAEEKLLNGGLTNADLISALMDQRETLCSDLVENIEDHFVISKLSRHGFEIEMKHQAMTGKPFTPNQLTVVREICAKKASGARKNSKKYLSALENVSTYVDDLQLTLNSHADQLAAINNKIYQLRQL